MVMGYTTGTLEFDFWPKTDFRIRRDEPAHSLDAKSNGRFLRRILRPCFFFFFEGRGIYGTV